MYLEGRWKCIITFLLKERGGEGTQLLYIFVFGGIVVWQLCAVCNAVRRREGEKVRFVISKLSIKPISLRLRRFVAPHPRIYHRDIQRLQMPLLNQFLYSPDIPYVKLRTESRLAKPRSDRDPSNIHVFEYLINLVAPRVVRAFFDTALGDVEALGWERALVKSDGTLAFHLSQYLPECRSI